MSIRRRARRTAVLRLGAERAAAARARLGTATCIAGACVRVAFVTSASYPTNFGGLTYADTQCQTLAKSVHLFGAFLSWLADDTQSPSTRFTQSQFPYVRIDGVEIAKNWAALISGALEAPVSVDETGETVGANTEAFTGTNADGTALPKLTTGSSQPATSAATLDGQPELGPSVGGHGDATATSSQWSFVTNGESGCDYGAPLLLPAVTRRGPAAPDRCPPRNHPRERAPIVPLGSVTSPLRTLRFFRLRVFGMVRLSTRRRLAAAVHAGRRVRSYRADRGEPGRDGAKAVVGRASSSPRGRFTRRLRRPPNPGCRMPTRGTDSPGQPGRSVDCCRR